MENQRIDHAYYEDPSIKVKADRITPVSKKVLRQLSGPKVMSPNNVINDPSLEDSSEDSHNSPKGLLYDEEGYLKIHRAIIDQDAEAVWKCWEELKEMNLSVDQRTKGHRYTCLQLAIVHNSNREILELLLQLGADPLAFDGRGRSTLLLALQPIPSVGLQSALSPSARHLIRLLTSGRRHLFEEACCQTDSDGLTVLMHCAINGWLESMRMLLVEIPSHLVDIQHPANGMTALHMAMLAYSSALDKGDPTDKSLRCIYLLKTSGASDVANIHGVTPDQLARTSLLKGDTHKGGTNQMKQRSRRRTRGVLNGKTKCVKLDESDAKDQDAKRQRVTRKHPTPPLLKCEREALLAEAGDSAGVRGRGAEAKLTTNKIIRKRTKSKPFKTKPQIKVVFQREKAKLSRSSNELVLRKGKGATMEKRQKEQKPKRGERGRTESSNWINSTEETHQVTRVSRSGLAQNKIKKFLSSSHIKKSLENICHDVEIIKQAIMLQEGLPAHSA